MVHHKEFPHISSSNIFNSYGKNSRRRIENIPEEKLKIIHSVFNNINNKNGQYIKFILGSKVINEGVDLKNVGEVHILDVHYNLGKVDQAIGRAIRYCSHWQLMNENNIYPKVNVYKYVVGLGESELSTEEELYRKAELKYILIKKVERIIKEVAIDCPINYNGNVFKEELIKYKDCEKTNSCPVTCEYMNCDYKCYDPVLNTKYYDPERNIYKTIKKMDLDDSTFSQKLAKNEINDAKKKIKELYILNFAYTLNDIIKYVKNNQIRIYMMIFMYLKH